MNKELEEAKKVLEEMKYQIKIKNKKIENDIYDNDIFTSMYEERNSQIQAIETVLNHIDNSISKEKVENKIEILKMEEHYDYIDNKKAITVLQELLEGK